MVKTFATSWSWMWKADNSIGFGLVWFYSIVVYFMTNPVYTECLKINATHLYDNDLLLREVQWWLLGTGLVKIASFKLETSN